MSNAQRSENEGQTVDVALTQQQYVVIEKLRAEGQFGRADGEIIRRIFQEFLRQEGLSK